MVRRMIAVVLVALIVAPVARAEAWRFRWHKGQVLTYRVEHTTTISQVLAAGKTTTGSKLNLVKRWEVQDVDASGVATLHLSLTAMRNEITTPDGEVLVYDSTNPDKSNAQLREQLGKYVGSTLAVLRVDGKGSVIEVKESKHGSASRYESDPPFKLTLPDGVPGKGAEWGRSYRVTLDPPLGTGQKFNAVQKYTCKAIDGTLVTVTLATGIASPPESVLDQVPLLQFQPEGEIVFDAAAGMVRSARLRIEKELKGHQGEGSSYRFQSSYTEEYVADK